MEHKGGGGINYNWFTWNNPQDTERKIMRCSFDNYWNATRCRQRSLSTCKNARVDLKKGPYLRSHTYIHTHIHMNVSNVKFYPRYFNHLYLPSRWGCRIHRLLLCRGVRPPPTSDLHMTLNNLMVSFQQCWSFGECRVPLHCHRSQVHSGLSGSTW